MTKRAILYARVSTDEQAEKGYGLPGQLDAMRQYAARNGFEIMQEFQEDYTGRVALAERPEGKKLTALLADSRQVDAVIAHRVDRIARDSFFARLAVRDWLKRGLDVHTCDVGRIDDDNGIVFTIMNWQGNDDYKKIIANTSRGRNTKASQGKVVGTARPPYGYRFIKDANGKTIAFEIYEPEARIVRLIYTWYVRGDEHGKQLTLMGVAMRLSGMGLLSPRQNNKRAFSKTAWMSSTVRFILSNETYCGVWHYRKVDKSGGQVHYRDASERIAVSVPAIVGREIWERAQARREYNAKMSKRNSKREYLLRCRVRCGCGRAMVGVMARGKAGKEYFYYACGASDQQVETHQTICSQKVVRCERLDNFVWESVKELFSDPDRLRADLKRAQQAELGAQDPRRDEIQAVENFIRQAEAEIDEIAVALRKASGRVGESLKKQMDDANARYDSYITRRAEIQKELGARKLTDDTLKDIVDYAKDVRLGIDKADFATKQKILESLDVRVKVDGDKAQVSCVITDSTSSTISCRTRSANCWRIANRRQTWRN